MNYAALFHACRKPWAYPLDDGQLRVVLKAAKGDLATAACLCNDRYKFEDFEQDDMLPMERLGDDGIHEYWATNLPAPNRRVRYAIHVQGVDGNCAWLTERGLVLGNLRGHTFEYPYIHKGDAFRQPAWLREAILYGIYPARFCNGHLANDPVDAVAWGGVPEPWQQLGGDLAGIRQRMGYLKDLGINAIWMTPIFKSPSPHKYDTTDYYQVDPAYGTNEEFKAAVEDAHQRGIRVLLTAVFNHSGRHFFAFADLLKSGRRSEYKKWYYDIQSYPVRTDEPNYEAFALSEDMPKFDTTNPEVADYLLKVAEHWTRGAGVDGWRTDSHNEVDHNFWRAFRQRVKQANPEAFIYGDSWTDATGWVQGDQLDGALNHTWRDATVDFLKGAISALEYDRKLVRIRYQHTAEVARGMVCFLTTFDHPRVRTEVGSREKAAQAALLLLTAEGVPMVYYGDEVGMEGDGWLSGSRGCYPWDDPAAQDQELLALYKRLIWVRRAYPWLNDGGWQTVTADPVTGLYCYKRTPTASTVAGRPLDEPGMYAVINNSARSLKMPLPTSGAPIDLLAGHMQTGEITGRYLQLPPRGIALLAPKALPAKMIRM